MTRIDHKKTTNKFFGRWGDFKVGEGEVTAENVVDCLLLRIIQEWRQATEENIEDDSKRPHVGVGSNRTFGDCFWWKKFCPGLWGIISHVASYSSQL